MNQRDQEKLIKDGYTILRIYDTPEPCIKFCSAPGTWKLHSKYATKSARDRILNVLVENPKFIME